MKKHTHLEVLKQEFLEYIELEQGRSEKTVENYAHYLSRFLAQTHIDTPHSITCASVHSYQQWLGQREAPRGGTLSVKTQNYHLNALRTFLTYLRARDIRTLEPKEVKLAPVHTTQTDRLTDGELTRLLQAPEGSDLKIVRDRAILHTLTATGMRVSELCMLDRSTAYTLVSSESAHALQTWQHMRTDQEDALFIAIGPRAIEGENRLTPRSVQRIVKYYATKAGIVRQITPHTLRYAHYLG